MSDPRDMADVRKAMATVRLMAADAERTLLAVLDRDNAARCAAPSAPEPERRERAEDAFLAAWNDATDAPCMEGDYLNAALAARDAYLGALAETTWGEPLPTKQEVDAFAERRFSDRELMRFIRALRATLPAPPAPAVPSDAVEALRGIVAAWETGTFLAMNRAMQDVRAVLARLDGRDATP